MSTRSLISDKVLMPFLLRFQECPPWPWYEDLLRLDRADRDYLRRRQWERLLELINCTKINVPYYAESFAETGLRVEDLRSWEDILALPMIDKNQIAANFPDRITSQKSNRESWQYFATSGTTDRLMVIKDPETISRNIALALYGQRIQGTYTPGSLRVSIPPDACSITCGAAMQESHDIIPRLKKTYDTFSERGYKRLPRLLVGQLLRSTACPSKELPSFGSAGTRVDYETLQWYIDRIGRWQPEVLSGLPEYLQLLALCLERTSQKTPQIGALLPEGALSTPTLKGKLSQVFAAPVHEVYGGHEFGCIGSTCERGEKMHVMMSDCLVEIVRNGRHAAPGEIGEVLITSFNNKAMPLIRYKPGDVGRLYEDYCSCGRCTQLLTVEGRIQDTMVTSRGIVTAQEIIEKFWTLPNVAFAQLVQRSDTRCDLLVVERESGRTNLSDLADSTAEFLGHEMRVRPRLVSTIKPEESGKFRFVKSLSYKWFHEV